MIEIIDLHEAVSADTRRVTVTGTLINRGTAVTTTLSVTVHALDEHGHPVLSISAVPSTNHVDAHGGRATFSATLDNRPEVRRYHVEAIAR